MDRRQEYLDLVDELNEELYNKFGDNIDMFYYYTSIGFVDIIGFGGTALWCSEDDDRKFSEETGYEPLQPFIKKQLAKYGKQLIAHSKA